MSSQRIVLLLLPMLLAAQPAWRVTSGGVEYRLERSAAGIAWSYFGPEREKPWAAPSSDMDGLVENQSLTAANLDLAEATTASQELKLRMRHKRLPVEVEARYRGWGATGTLTRELRLMNRGERALRVISAPSLAWRLPPGEYELTYLFGGWGQERQVVTESLGAGSRTFVNRTGRSTNGASPWFCLHNKTLGVRYAGQLAWSGNWEMSFERAPVRADLPVEQGALTVKMGMRFDFGGALTLAPGESFDLPAAAFTATAGDLDDAANALHRYQRQFVVPAQAANRPMLVQFNSWYPFPGKLTVAEMKRCAELAAKLGAEVFVLDAGWYNQKDWSTELGDYRADPVAFPNGLIELPAHVRARGMKFGIWVEIENVGERSLALREHADWLLKYNGDPVANGRRRQFDFAKPEVRAWASGVVARLMAETGGLDWIKIDYNIDIGEAFDGGAGDALYRHVRAYYGWLDEIRAKYPNLVVENCSSGGLRFDLGILGHTHTTWLSDEILPKQSVQLAYGCTVEFLPEACNHWMVGEAHDGRVDLNAKPGWWDFLFRVPMNGQFGLSSRVFDWNDRLRERAEVNIRRYKSIRGMIAGADVYHLTPPPAHVEPEGWTAMQYAQPDRRSAVVLAYRLGRSLGEQTLRLRGLDAQTKYLVEWDGSLRTGAELMTQGITVKLDEPWRAGVIEIHAER